LVKIKEHVVSRLQEHVPPSLKDKVLEREEKELLEEEELEKLFLKKIFAAKLWKSLWILGVTVMSYFLVAIIERVVARRRRNLISITSR
jgi:hypothetical protein